MTQEAFDKSGFNPHKKNGFGSGIMCGLLFTFDLPLTIIAWIFALFKIKIRSFGAVAFESMRNRNETTLGSLMGFLLMSCAVGAWFNPEYQFTMIVIGSCFAFLGIIATIKNVVR